MVTFRVESNLEFKLEIRCPYCEGSEVHFEKVIRDLEDWKVERWVCEGCGKGFFVKFRWEDNVLEIEVGKRGVEYEEVEETRKSIS